MKKFFINLFVVIIFVFSIGSVKASKTFERAGDAFQIAIPLSALGISWAKDDTQGMKELLYSVLTSTAVTWALKLAVNKKRPKGGRYSFPSGHTSLAFSGSSYLGFRYGMLYGTPSAVASSFVGASRIQARRHDWADVIAGAVIGVGSAFVFTHKYDSVKATTTFK